MRLEPIWVEVILGGVGPVSAHGDAGDVALRARMTGATTKASLGPLAVEVEGAVDGDGWRLTWSITNTADHPEAVRSVRVGCAVVDAAGPLRFWSHGYQSWSPSRVLRYGTDIDLSLRGHAPRLLRAMYHADEELAEPGELRSEMVCALADGPGPVTVVGFLGGVRHAGTFRLGPRDEVDRSSDPLRPGPADRPAVLVAEAFLGGAVLASGEDRDLHTVVASVGAEVSSLLAGWARSAGAAGGARTSAPYRVGWWPGRRSEGTDSEKALLTQVGAAEDRGWPFTSAWIGDGYQAAIGDWLQASDGFTTPLDGLASHIAAAGYEPGIWLAPFLISRTSELAQQHPDWIAQWFRGGAPLLGMFDQRWGGTVYVLDTTNPEVAAHLTMVGRSLAEAGFRHVKVDFGYAASSGGRFHDPGCTPAQRTRAGFDALRQGLGDDVQLLASGVPFGSAIGVADAVQTGPNTYPGWWPDAVSFPSFDGYVSAKPAIAHAAREAICRSFLHRALWSNDPDSLPIGFDAAELSSDEADSWARVISWTGSAAMASGDVTQACDRQRRRFEEMVEAGRASDEAIRAGSRPSAPDLLVPDGQARLVGALGELVVDLERGTSDVRS